MRELKNTLSPKPQVSLFRDTKCIPLSNLMFSISPLTTNYAEANINRFNEEMMLIIGIAPRN